MDKKLLIDSYLEGKHPIEQEKWELPTESELDRDEALFDVLLDEKKNKTPLLRGRGWGEGLGVGLCCRSSHRCRRTLHLVELQASATHATRRKDGRTCRAERRV